MRTVAGIFLILGWIALVVGGLLSLGILFTLMSTMRGNVNALAMVGALTPLFMAIAASLSPFFLWAVLQALIEIYEAQRRTYEMLHSARDIEYSTLMTMQESTGIYDAFDRAAARGGTAPPGPAGRSAAVPPAPTSRTVPSVTSAPAAAVMYCHGCGWRNASDQKACQQCGVEL